MADPPPPRLLIITMQVVNQPEHEPLITLKRILSWPAGLGINLQRLDSAIARAAQIATTP